MTSEFENITQEEIQESRPCSKMSIHTGKSPDAVSIAMQDHRNEGSVIKTKSQKSHINSTEQYGHTWTKSAGLHLNMMMNDDSMISVPVVGPSPITAGKSDGVSGFITTQNMKDAIMNLQQSQEKMQYIQIEQPLKGKIDNDKNDTKSEDASTESEGTKNTIKVDKNVSNPDLAPSFMASRNALHFMNEPQMSEHIINHPSNPSSKVNLNNVASAHFKSASSLIKLHTQPSSNKNTELFVWGLNDNHQLGQVGSLESQRGKSRSYSPMSVASNVLIPRQVRNLDFKIQNIVCGKCHTLILSQDGELYALGNNSHGQLGFKTREQPIISWPKKINLRDTNNRVQLLACSSTHSIIQTQDGTLYSSGLNNFGQLGVQEDGIVIEQFSRVNIRDRIDRFSCCDTASAFLNIDYQKLYIYGQFETPNQNTDRSLPLSMKSLDLSQCINNDYIIDIKCGKHGMILMSYNGQVYHMNEEFQIKQLLSLNNVKEIQSCGLYFAALTTFNQIYHWKHGHIEPFKMLDIGQPGLTASGTGLSFSNLAIGEDFGHIVDQSGNLHGWGNNKNGELGTCDSYPRQRLAQIRIFNNDKQYMRCQRIFNGNNFALGLFESNASPNGIDVNSPLRSGPIDSQGKTMRTASVEYQHSRRQIGMSLTQNVIARNAIENGSNIKTLSSRFARDSDMAAKSSISFRNQEQRSSSLIEKQRRQAQYEATEAAIQKYREQAKNYRENISRIKQNVEESMRNELIRDSERELRNRSASPYVQTTLKQPSDEKIMDKRTKNSSLQNERYSPDILVTRKPFENEYGNQQNQHSGTSGERINRSQLYSFSQLQHAFDETRYKQESERQQMPEYVETRHKNSTQMREQEEFDLPKQIDYRVYQKVGLKGNSRNENKYRDRSHPIQGSYKHSIADDSLQPPTVTSIEALDFVSHRQREKRKQEKQIRQSSKVKELNRIIERSISATSSLLDKSYASRKERESRSRSRSKSRQGRNSNKQISQTQPKMNQDILDEDTSYKKSGNGGMILTPDQSHTQLYQENWNPNSTQDNRQSIKGTEKGTETFDISASAICTSVNPSANMSRYDLHHQRSFNPYSEVPTSRRVNDNDTHHKTAGHIPKAQHRGRSHYDQPKSTAGRSSHTPNNVTKEKLNKYKRKLKKYFAKNAEQQSQIKMLTDKVSHLEKQKQRIMKQEKIDYAQKKKQIEHLESSMKMMEEKFKKQLQKQQEEIRSLTKENIQMIKEIQDRDEKHRTLDERLEYVDLEIENLGHQLKEQKSINHSLRQEIRDKQHSQDLDVQIEAQQNQIQVQTLQQQLHESLEQNNLKDEELMKLRGEVHALQKRRGDTREKTSQLEATVAALQNQVYDLSHINYNLKQQMFDYNQGLVIKNNEIMYQNPGTDLMSQRHDIYSPPNQENVGDQPLTFKPSVDKYGYDDANEDDENQQERNIVEQEYCDMLPGEIAMEKKIREIMKNQSMSYSNTGLITSHEDDDRKSRSKAGKTQTTGNTVNNCLSGANITQQTSKVKYELSKNNLGKKGFNVENQQTDNSMIDETNRQYNSNSGVHSSLNVSQINQNSGAKLFNNFDKNYNRDPSRSRSGPHQVFSQNDSRDASVLDETHDYNQHQNMPEQILIQNHDFANQSYFEGSYMQQPINMIHGGQTIESNQVRNLQESYPNYAYVQQQYFNGYQVGPQVRVQPRQAMPQTIDTQIYKIPQQYYGQIENPQIDPSQPAIPYDPNMSTSGGTSAHLKNGALTSGSPRSMVAGPNQYGGSNTYQFQSINAGVHEIQEVLQPRSITLQTTQNIFSQRIPQATQGNFSGPNQIQQNKVPGVNIHFPQSPMGLSNLGSNQMDTDHRGSTINSSKKQGVPKFSELTSEQQRQVLELMKNHAFIQSIPNQNQFNSRSRSAEASGPYGVDSGAPPSLIPYTAKTAQTTLLPPPHPKYEKPNTRVGRWENQSANLDEQQIEEKQNSIHQTEPSFINDGMDSSVISYKDQILNKFSKRANKEIIEKMKKRDQEDPILKTKDSRNQLLDQTEAKSEDDTIPLTSDTRTVNRSVQPVVIEEKLANESMKVENDDLSKSRSTSNPQRFEAPFKQPALKPNTSLQLSYKREAFDHSKQNTTKSAARKSSADVYIKKDFGEIRSTERMRQQRQKLSADAKQVQEYREKSKEWLKRKGREQEELDIEANKVANKYKEAFRNLSVELKKKIVTTATAKSQNYLEHNDSFSKYIQVENSNKNSKQNL